MARDTSFVRSSFCTMGSCVAVALGADGRVAVRNSGDPDGPVVEFSRDEWAAFVLGVKNGEFDPAG
ncbi:MAG TPA: DUF397 domain-containing protein [Pseudonocardiaceae bacterium]